MGCYLAPNNTSMIESVVAALKERPMGAKLLVEGDFKANLVDPEGDRSGEDIAAALATEGLEDMSAYFRSRWFSWCRDGRTWSMIREGREVQSRTDYILGTDRRLFGNVSVGDPRHNSDHYIVLGCLHISSLKEHAQYLGGRKKLPLRPPTEPSRQDIIFAALRRAVTKPRAWGARKIACISEATWILVNERFSACQDLSKYQTLVRRLVHAIRASLTMDRRRRVEEAGAEVEALFW